MFCKYLCTSCLRQKLVSFKRVQLVPFSLPNWLRSVHFVLYKYKMRGNSIWNIWTLLKWEAKLAHWSGTKWTDSMFYITTDWKSITNREKWKSEKRDKYSFTSQIRGLIQNIWNLIFSDFDSPFLILGGVCEENA